MLSIVKSMSLLGLEGILIDVEVDISSECLVGMLLGFLILI